MSNNIRKQLGFTLIEMLVVLTILAGLITIVVVPRISPLDRVRTVVRHLTVMTRQTQTAARLSGSIYRIVFEMPDDEKKSHSFWVESATQKDISLSMSNEDDKDKKDGEATSETNFAMDTKISKKKETLPSGFYFEDIQFSEKQKISQGKAYIYFFPQGFVTKAAIHITNKKQIHWTVILNPLTGYGQVLDTYRSIGETQ
jgi:general secretion pathway protein H